MPGTTGAKMRSKAVQGALSRSIYSAIPPNSRTTQSFNLLGLARQIMDMMKLIKSNSSKESSTVDGPQDGDCKNQNHDSRANPKERMKGRASSWNAETCQYQITESAVPEELSELDEYVFVVRTRVERKTEESLVFIDINSQGLRDVLRNVLQDVKSANLRPDRPTIEQNLLYNMLPDLEASQQRRLSDSSRDDVALRHMDLLLRYVEGAYATVTSIRRPLLDHVEITFDLLWSLFRPNVIVYTECRGTGRPKCFKYDFGEYRTEMGETKFCVEGRNLDYDGKQFGDVSITVEIPKFHGIKRIDSLSTFPLDYHPQSQDVRALLIERGRKFISLIGTHHQHYRGCAFIKMKGKIMRVQADSRIMVDAQFFREKNPNYFNHRVDDTLFLDEDGVYCIDLAFEKKTTHNVTNHGHDPTKLSEEDLLRCSATVPGFSFGDKMWLEFAVADIQDIRWESNLFDTVSMPADQKDLILSLAEARTQDVNIHPFDDIVPGKGRGLNVLLHGSPGTGKTLTAEAVSEHLKRPLYSISAGELGTDPAGLEEQLTHIFHLGSHWNAVLLLDEADTYMEKRSVQDVYRNSLVTVFLRKLEYCGAILFLTTNRVTEFDDAILSRMHIMFAFPNIGLDSKKKIWKFFIRKAQTAQGPAKVEPKELNRLSETPLNARQIKNVVATAHAIAGRQESLVLYSHIKKAVDHTTAFMDDFNGMNQMRGLYN